VQSVSTSAPPTRSSPSSRAASRPSSPTPKAPAPPRPSSRFQERRGARRRGRQAPGRHQRRPHHPLRQAPHGHRLDRRHRRQEVHAAGDQRPHPAEAQARRRGLPGRARHRRRHHRPGLLQRRRASGHQGGRRDRGPERPAHHQRAHRRRPGLRPRQGQGRRAILVFDLGGGTFDVSLLEVGKDDDGFSTIQVKATVRATTASAATTGISASSTGSSQRVQEQATASTCPRTRWPCSVCGGRRAGQEGALLLDEETSINLPYISMTRERPAAPGREAHPRQFEEMTKDLLDRCKAPFNNVIKDAGISVSEIDHVVLVGGSTRMPAVTDLVKELTGGKEPNKGVNPDEVVAVGAALQAGVLKGERQGRPAARRHPAVPRHRDQGRRHDQAHRAQHHDPDQALRDLHHGRGQPAVRPDPGVPGRA
jgi:hypothetical protein